jgi:hypothetical protein
MVEALPKNAVGQPVEAGCLLFVLVGQPVEAGCLLLLIDR